MLKYMLVFACSLCCAHMATFRLIIVLSSVFCVLAGVSLHNTGVSLHDAGVSLHNTGVSLHNTGVSLHNAIQVNSAALDTHVPSLPL